jgi:threonine dehydrogenase-like Zn-dependent dehydrogenase
MKATDLPRAIAVVESGRVDLSGLVTELHALADGPAAFASLVERRSLKVVVEP